MENQQNTASHLMELENKYGAHNYHPLPRCTFERERCVFMGC